MGQVIDFLMANGAELLIATLALVKITSTATLIESGILTVSFSRYCLILL
jgi:hypothetical protein